MKLSLGIVSCLALGLAACGTLRASEQVATGATSDEPKCAGEVCPATVECTDRGTCIIRWGSGPDRCEVELACDGESCEVVRCDGPEDCRSACQAK